MFIFLQEKLPGNDFIPYVVAPLNDLQILNLDGEIDPNLQKLYVSIDNEHLENSENGAVVSQENIKDQVKVTHSKYTYHESLNVLYCCYFVL